MPIPSAPPRSAGASSSPVSPRATFPALAAPAFNPLDDPPDVDISTPDALQGFGDIPNLLAQDPNNLGDTPDFLTALLSGAGGAAGGDGLPQQFAQMFGGQPGSTPLHIQAPKKKTWVDRLLPLVHLLSMVGLAFYAIFIIEPRIREGYGSIYAAFSDRFAWTSIGNVDWNGWAALSRGKQGDSTTSQYAQGLEKAWLGTGRGVATVVSSHTNLILRCSADCLRYSANHVSLLDARVDTANDRHCDIQSTSPVFSRSHLIYSAEKRLSLNRPVHLCLHFSTASCPTCHRNTHHTHTQA